MTLAREALLRARLSQTGRVTPVELFLDLVFVFAITELAHDLLANLSFEGGLHTGILLLAIWWAWLYTSWITSWWDPEGYGMRLTLLAIALVSLLMSASIPGAFGRQALGFAVSYLTIQLGRTAYLLFALGRDHPLTSNFRRVTAWFAFSGVFWIGGALLNPFWQPVLWVIALAIDYIAPVAGFRTPKLGRSHTHEWQIEGTHLAERCQLFIILALGESILITGATTAELRTSLDHAMAFIVAFIGSAALWWLYFDRSAEAGAAAIAQSDDPGRFARSAYNYFHVVMVAGIILTSVGDELSIAHPGESAGWAGAVSLLGGPVLYLVGHGLFKWSLGYVSWSRITAIALLCLLAPTARGLPKLALATIATTVLIGVAIWDAFHHRALARTAEARGEGR